MNQIQNKLIKHKPKKGILDGFWKAEKRKTGQEYKHPEYDETSPPQPHPVRIAWAYIQIFNVKAKTVYIIL